MTTKTIETCAECPCCVEYDPDPRPTYHLCNALHEEVDERGRPPSNCPWRPENGGPVTLRLAEGV